MTRVCGSQPTKAQRSQRTGGGCRRRSVHTPPVLPRSTEMLTSAASRTSRCLLGSRCLLLAARCCRRRRLLLAAATARCCRLPPLALPALPHIIQQLHHQGLERTRAGGDLAHRQREAGRAAVRASQQGLTVRMTLAGKPMSLPNCSRRSGMAPRLEHDRTSTSQQHMPPPHHVGARVREGLHSAPLPAVIQRLRPLLRHQRVGSTEHVQAGQRGAALAQRCRIRGIPWQEAGNVHRKAQLVLPPLRLLATSRCVGQVQGRRGRTLAEAQQPVYRCVCLQCCLDGRLRRVPPAVVRCTRRPRARLQVGPPPASTGRGA